MRRSRLLTTGGVLAATVALLASAPLAAADSTTTIRVDESGDGGWLLNEDPVYAVPAEFVDGIASTGTGSLMVGPIPAEATRKFIGGKAYDLDTSDFHSVSVDVRMGAGSADDSEQVYVNVRTNLPDSTSFFDCRFDFVLEDGSDSTFTTLTAAADDEVGAVPRGGALCPSSIGDMPDGSRINAIVLNVGDTSANDVGVVAYLDNVVITTADGTTAYDLEVPLRVKADCKDGGWTAFGFRNQGECISSLQAASD